MVRTAGNSNNNSRHSDASASPRSSPRIRVSRRDDDGDQQSSYPPPLLRLPDAHLRHLPHQHQQQYPQAHHQVHAQHQHHHAVHEQQHQQQHLTRSRSSPSIVLGAAPHPQSVRPGSSAANAASLYWTHHGERNGREQLASVHVQQQHYQYEYDQEDPRQRGAAREGQLYQHRLDTYQSLRQSQQQFQTSSYEMYEMDQQQDAPRRSFMGKRKASDEAGELMADYTPQSYYDNVHLTLPATTLSPGSSSDRSPASRSSEQQSRAASADAAAMQTRRSFPPYPQSQAHAHSQQQFTPPHPQSHRPLHTGGYHGNLPAASSDNSVHQQQQQQQRWLHRQEEETKEHHHLQRRGRSSEASLSPLALAAQHPHASSSPPVAQPRMARQRPHQQPAAVPRVTVTTLAPEPTLLPSQTRVITNASRNITFAMLQPHFERPLQEAALRFGVCTTLLKKVCRKNGIKNWPFRRICGLHKSIASMEKQVHYFDGEQKRSYADQLYKLQLELAAYKRTGNALTEEFQAKVEAEGGLGSDNSNMRMTSPGYRQQGQGRHDDDDDDDDHAETKTENVEIAFNYSNDGEGDEDENQNSAALSPPTLSAVSTRISVSSYRYAASPTNQDEEDRENQANEGEGQLTQQPRSYAQQQYASVRHVMAATVDLGYDDHDERQPQLRPQPRHVQQQQQQQGHHHHHAGNLHGSRTAPTTTSSHPNRYLAPPQGPVLQRALPSLSFMLHRQSLSQQQEQRADGSSTSPPAAPRAPGNPHYYQPS